MVDGRCSFVLLKKKCRVSKEVALVNKYKYMMMRSNPLHDIDIQLCHPHASFHVI